MNILILGGGAREHALAWACAQNPACDRLVCAPGNAGTEALAENAALDILDGENVARFCADRGIDFVIVGPEAPLAAGVADVLRAAGVATLGPSAEAARLESSKAFTKEVCDAAGAPTAAWARFEDADAAKAHVRAGGAPVVVKADGLAAGKGVVVAESVAEAEGAVDDLLALGGSVVVEAFLRGEEASLFVLCDGEAAVPVGTAQDHKRAGEGDTGPNTGGMGAYSPAPVCGPEVERRAMDRIVRPVLREMARRGTPFTGVLYAGLMIEDGAPSLVEFNVRFGDPECQALMMRLGAQALDLMLACAEGRLEGERASWADDHAMTVVLAARGYPGGYAKDERIGGLDALPATADQQTFHAGTAREGGMTVSAGGRVLSATGRGATLAEARRRAYALAGAVEWPGGTFRRDIGWRAL
ncbi:phosphoribosylamine--glycine ligase [Hasllibacter halocynthiae]|uniref:Phosphoribosylamine--glycine ligase n=1 Tax=Hasllibacter halocynthiae TaxID=595589 RepID=A0A2T0X6A9_9RHOB|nr:phosphoribosylamine--glycine ligase [Hasllibacter halocynthiae]PRY94478.1 phosphoribosylamine--glycine ligase [Hasllibacter halocynthiae]